MCIGREGIKGAEEWCIIESGVTRWVLSVKIDRRVKIKIGM